MFECGTIVLIPFPFTDLTAAKMRPALIVSKKPSIDNDIMVSFITSKTNKNMEKSDFLLDENATYFKKTGLKTGSVIKFNKLATLNKKLILGELGKIPKNVFPKLGVHLQAAFGL